MTDPETPPIPATPEPAKDALGFDYSNDNCCVITCEGQPVGLANRTFAWNAPHVWEARVSADTGLARLTIHGQGATPRAAVENAFMLYMAGFRAVREMRALMGLLPSPAKIRSDEESKLSAAKLLERLDRIRNTPPPDLMNQRPPVDPPAPGTP